MLSGLCTTMDRLDMPTRFVFSQHWLYCSSQVSHFSSSSVNTGLIVQVKAVQLVRSQHWFDCSNQGSQLNSSSSTLVWPFKSGQLNSFSLNTTCFARMISASQLHAFGMDELHPSPCVTVLKTDNQWEALDHNLMGFAWGGDSLRCKVCAVKSTPHNYFCN